jgi:peptidoglycan/xylan/chitin deacetylase (PgdA/CDA1 family)
MYHRVGNVPVDPWGLAVTPLNFERQIEILMKRRQVVSLRDLPEAVRRWRRGRRPIVAVTFDDGYHDVYLHARPVLQQHRCPATVFITTGAIDSGREFWWDALGLVLLETSVLPPNLALRIRDVDHNFSFSPGNDAVERDRIYRAVWALLRPLEQDLRNGLLDELMAWAGCDPKPRPSHRAMTSREVAELSDELISIGAHTVTHPTLPALTPQAQYEEVLKSKLAAETMAARTVDLFSYPYGDFNEGTVAAVKKAGLSIACTVESTFVPRSFDPLRLPRVYVGDWGAESFARHLERDPYR